MTRKIKSVKGLFGQTTHYENGVKVGESWPGLFEGSQKHYDADGKYAGYSDRGILLIRCITMPMADISARHTRASSARRSTIVQSVAMRVKRGMGCLGTQRICLRRIQIPGIRLLMTICLAAMTGK